MGYRNLRACVADLERTGQLVRIDAEIDPHLEMAEIQRRVYQAQGPALLFTRVKGCAFPMVGNLFGTLDRTRYPLPRRSRRRAPSRRTEDRPGRVLEETVALPRCAAHPVAHAAAVSCALGRSSTQQTTIRELPQLKCWPRDGGAFVTLPQVYTEDAEQPGWRHSNLGMYRVQLSGNEYRPDRGSRPALPDSSRHRRASRQGASPRRAVSRQRLRRRPAGA